MSNPALWYAFIVAFLLTAAMNISRGLRRTDARRPVNIALGVASIVFASAAALFRFVGATYGYAAAGVAVVVMVIAAASGARQQG